jgi:hypothetical protein
VLRFFHGRTASCGATAHDPSRPLPTALDTQVSTIEQVADRYAKAGHPHHPKPATLLRQRPSRPPKKETAIGSEIYLVTPQSVARHIAQIEELNASDMAATRHDVSRHVATPVLPQQSTAEPAAPSATAGDTSRYVARLEIEIEQAKDEREFLREQIDR